jgi:hypothetical protein
MHFMTANNPLRGCLVEHQQGIDRVIPDVRDEFIPCDV